MAPSITGSLGVALVLIDRQANSCIQHKPQALIYDVCFTWLVENITVQRWVFYPFVERYGFTVSVATHLSSRIVSYLRFEWQECGNKDVHPELVTEQIGL